MAIRITDGSANFDEWRINTNMTSQSIGDIDNLNEALLNSIVDANQEINIVNAINMISDEYTRLNIIRASVLA